MDKSYKYFISVVQARSISKASIKLHISQPALSTSIKILESQLKTELLVRSKKGISLTDAGNTVYNYALALQDIEKNIFLKLHEKANTQHSINVGAIDSVAPEIVPYINTKGGLSQISVDNSKRLISKVMNGQLDVAYTTQPKKEYRELEYKLIAKETMVAVALTQPKEPIPLLAYNANSNTHRHILKALKNAKIKSKVILHSTDPHILLEAARLGKGVAIVPKSLFLTSNDPKLIHVFKKLKISRPIVEVTRKARYSPEIIKNFALQISQSLK